MKNLQEFCALGNGTSLIVWNTNDFGPCFKLLCLVLPANIFLICSSIFFSSGKRQRFQLPESRLYLFSNLQILVSFSIFLESLIEVLCSWFVNHYHPPVYLVTSSLVAIAWISNAVCVRRNRVVILVKKCYATVHIMFIILAFFMTTLQLYSVILSIKRQSFDSLLVYEYGTICRFSLQIIFLLLLIPPICVNRDWIGLHVEFSSSAASSDIQGGTERDALLRNASRGTFYSGTQCISDDLGVAEEKANILSKLTFWWVRPMMKKGSKGNLQYTEDLFLLPQSLSTKRLRILFSANFDSSTEDLDARNKLEDSFSSESGYGGITFSPGTIQKSVSDPNFRRYSNVRRMTSNGSHASTEFSEKEGNGSGPEVSNPRSLLSALNHSFGLQYYCIGLLKLTGDALSFAGPLLLHALVSFMENRQVSQCPKLNAFQSCHLIA